jgi:hypothetical protein
MPYLTYAEEMKAKHPDRPWISRPTWELSNMARALSMLSWMNTPEEITRLSEVKAELKARRKEGRK